MHTSTRLLSLILALTVASFGRVAFSGQRPDAGLKMHYALDEGKGVLAHDGAPDGQDAQIHGAKWVKGVRGSALAFDGKSAFVDCGSGKRLALKDKLTVSAWINPKGKPSGEPVIVGETPRNWAITHYKGRAYFYISGGGNSRYVPVPYHSWTHVAGTYDGGTLRVYVNGQLRVMRKLPANTAIKSGGTVRIGGGNRKGSFYNGFIDDVRVYARALSDEEISQLAKTAEDAAFATPLTADQRRAAARFFKTHAEPVAFQQKGRQLWLANRHVGIEFVEGKSDVRLSRIHGIASTEDFLHEGSLRSPEGIWQLVLRRDRGRDPAEVTLTSRAQGRISKTTRRDGSALTLRLKWDGLAVADEPNVLDVEVLVTLKEEDPLSRWRINVTNRSKVYGLWQVFFPTWQFRPVGGRSESNVFAYGKSRGMVVKDPFHTPPERTFGIGGNYGCYWPGTLDMQFQALYDASGTGVYFGTHDGGGYKKIFYFSTNPDKQILEYRAGHYPANMGWPAEDYRMTHDVVVGPFRGDWYDACQVYRRWALKQQWCARGPLATRRDVPRWYKEAPLVFSTMTKEGEWRVEESKKRMIAFLKFLDTRLPIAWYTWKKHFPETAHYNRDGSPWKVPDARPYPCGNIHDGNDCANHLPSLWIK